MKTIKTILATAVAIFTVSTVSASGAGGLKVDMEADKADFMSVEISSVATSHFEIDLMNDSGDNLYSMTTEAPRNNLKKTFDFSDLEDGVYYFNVKMDNESTVKTLKVKYGVVEVINERRSIEPYFIFKDDLLKFTYLNPQLEDTKLIVYNKYNEIVSEVELGNALSISKALNFNGQNYGEYEVVIANDMDVYEYTVSID